MYITQVTLLATATPLIPKAVVPANSKSFSLIMIQYNGTGNLRVGDSTVSATRGILLSPSATAGAMGGSATLTPSLQFSGDLCEFYFFGTAGQVVDILILD